MIRDVIGVHMEELSNHWQEENRLDNAEISDGGKSKSSGRYVTAGKFLRGVRSLTACYLFLIGHLPTLAETHVQFILY